MVIKNTPNVFQHEADSVKLVGLRDAVIDDVYLLLRRPVVFRTFHASGLLPDEWSQMREKYRRLLHYGRLNRRALANELIWKWTEATGKYLGCQFWSTKAKELFDLEVASGEDPKKAVSMLSKRNRPKEAKLTHEHVYPIKDMVQWLEDRKQLDRDEIRTHLEQICIGCVVLESEHRCVSRTPGNDENPWLRYKSAGIKLAPNAAWPDAQRALIDQAGLLPTL
jgi:hypothetical protein